MNPDVLITWLPPGKMTGKMHAFDGRVGGGYEMSLFYPEAELHVPGKSAEHEDRVAVRFLELSPPHRIVEAVNFATADPFLIDEMTITVTFRGTADGTDVTMLFENLPAGVRPEDNDAGARESLAQLARLFE
jgi:uncharacterized protein YndB with AHSA1/START domain